LSRDDPTWTARIPADVKEYLQKKGLSAGQCLINYYKFLKQQEIPELLQEKKELEERVRQIDQIVTHGVLQKQDIVTHIEILKKEYIDSGRSIDRPTHQDRNWINARCKKEKLDPEEFLRYLKDRGE